MLSESTGNSTEYNCMCQSNTDSTHMVFPVPDCTAACTDDICKNKISDDTATSSCSPVVPVRLLTVN